MIGSDLNNFLAQLSSPDPVPGGGSVAALETAMGAALICMVANLTIGRKRYADVQEQVTAILKDAERLRNRAYELISEDVEAYKAVSDVMSLPRDTDEQRAERQARMQEALKGAVGPPLATMRSAYEVLKLADVLVTIGNKSAVSDVGTAASSAFAGCESAYLNVEINLHSIRDEEWVADVRAQMEYMHGLDHLAESVVERAGEIIRVTPN